MQVQDILKNTAWGDSIFTAAEVAALECCITAKSADVIIPLLNASTQTAIAEQVQRSFALRRQSERLLEQAKRAVEIAIEQGEGAAAEMLREVASRG